MISQFLIPKIFSRDYEHCPTRRANIGTEIEIGEAANQPLAHAMNEDVADMPKIVTTRTYEIDFRIEWIEKRRTDRRVLIRIGAGTVKITLRRVICEIILADFVSEVEVCIMFGSKALGLLVQL